MLWGISKAEGFLGQGRDISGGGRNKAIWRGLVGRHPHRRPSRSNNFPCIPPNPPLLKIPYDFTALCAFGDVRNDSIGRQANKQRFCPRS